MSKQTINKTTFFAAEMAGINQYQTMTPSEQLKYVVMHELGKISNAEFGSILKNRFPVQMTALSFEGARGNASIQAVKTSDYFGPGSGEGLSNIKGSGVVPILVADAIMEGAMPAVSARESVWNVPMNSEIMSVPFFTAKKYIPMKAPGADAYDLMQNVAHATLRAKTYTVKCGIGNELIEDANMDIISASLREMGQSMEMTINQKVYSVMLENCGNECAITTNATDATKAVFVAASYIKEDGFIPTEVVAFPGYWSELMTSLTPYYSEAAMQLAEGKRKIQYANLTYHDTAVSMDASITSKAINYPTASGYGAIVFDKTRAGALGIRTDMFADEFDDVLKYLKAPVMTSRFDFVAPIDENNALIHNKNASCAIKHA